MKKLIFTLTLSAIGFFAIGQNKISDRCGFNTAIEEANETNPGYKKQVNDAYINFLKRIKQVKPIRQSGTTYLVPVVFHVVWNSSTPEQNLHDSVLLEQINVLNEDFSRTNADTANLRSQFESIVGAPNIQFQLACTDPDGNPTTGIVRISTTTTFGGGFLPDMASISQIQHDSTGGSDSWDPTHYLNIWIGDINGGSTPSLLGIATPPPNLPNWPANSVPAELTDGVIIQWNAFGRNNPNSLNVGGGNIVVNGRTVTHEVGHYFGLRHTAENTFGGLLGSVCGDDDGLNDTPNCDQSQQGCDVSRNSCTDTIGTLGDLPDMVENYMDYSDQDCQNSFTIGQSNIMLSVVQNERVGLLSSLGLTNCNSVVGINEIDLLTTVYPNPSTGEFSIESSVIFDEIEIYNGVGQMIRAIQPTLTRTTFNLYEKGIYIVKIKKENQVVIRKVVVQ